MISSFNIKGLGGIRAGRAEKAGVGFKQRLRHEGVEVGCRWSNNFESSVEKNVRHGWVNGVAFFLSLVRMGE